MHYHREWESKTPKGYDVFGEKWIRPRCLDLAIEKLYQLALFYQNPKADLRSNPNIKGFTKVEAEVKKVASVARKDALPLTPEVGSPLYRAVQVALDVMGYSLGEILEGEHKTQIFYAQSGRSISAVLDFGHPDGKPTSFRVATNDPNFEPHFEEEISGLGYFMEPIPLPANFMDPRAAIEHVLKQSPQMLADALKQLEQCDKYNSRLEDLKDMGWNFFR